MKVSYQALCLALCLALAIAVGSGCGSAPKKLEPVSRPPPDQRPDDLALAATVFAPRVPLPEANLPRSIRPARYIVEADGVLRASRGGDADTSAFPARVRTLSVRQEDQLWRQLLDSGLLEESNPDRIRDPEGAVRSGDRTTALIYVSYEGQRMTLRVLLDRGTPNAVAAERLIDSLAELAFVRQ